MKYLDEFSDPDLAKKLVDQIHEVTTQPWAMMEVCGGQTHSIIRHGIDQLLPDEIEMIHGPGCPVCVTPLEMIDRALAVASQPGVIFCSFGDMLRVPGSSEDLFRIKSAGGDVRVVYSPLDALNLARENPDRQVVFFGIGFETTAPANAMTVYQANRLGIKNFSLLVSHVLVPPAMSAIMESPTCRVQGFLAAGHVCCVMGTHEYPPLADKYQVP
ncbi:MAG: hydrogenase formation protein HypD, partial [Actinomycetota bacterium]|nr:hydrogenase formation protein HypD [Actinomycetota bacterium]